MPNWNNNIITLTAKTDEAKKQLHTFIDKHVIEMEKKDTWNDSCLDLDSESIIPIPEGIHKLSNMAAILQTAEGIKDNPNYDEEAERKQKEQNIKDYGYEDWWSFCVNVWGSKWGFCHTSFNNEYGEPIESKEDLHKELDEKGEIEITTDCAWFPATGLMQKICELYPDIEFLCEWGEEQVTEYYGKFTYNKEDGWEEQYKKDIDVDEAYNMLDRLGLVNSEEDDGFFPNHNTGLVDYDERLDSDSEEYLTEDQREGIIFGDVSDDSSLDEKNMITPEQNLLAKE